MKTILLVIISLTLASCSTTPTGRSQLNLFPDSKMDSMGRQSYEEIKKKTPISRNPRYVSPTQCIVKLLLERNGFRSNEWELNVFADQAINAFALPGKKIGVYEGLFKAAKNQDQLAAVIGHEIGHVTAEHGNERVSQQVALQSLMLGTSIAIDSKSKNGQMILAAVGVGANFGLILPFSRKHESEADEIGLGYMARAGFNPAQAVDLWVNMSQQGKAPPEFMSTHPSSNTRIKDIRQLLPKMRQLQAQALSKYQAPDCGY